MLPALDRPERHSETPETRASSSWDSPRATRQRRDYPQLTEEDIRAALRYAAAAVAERELPVRIGA